MTTVDCNKDRVRAWFEAFNSGDCSALHAIHADECRNHAPAPFDVSSWPADGKPFGPDEFRATVEWIRHNQPDIRIAIERMIGEGDEVIAWIRSTGTATGSGAPIPPTGACIDFHQAHRFRFADGKIVEHWAVRDDLRSLVQAGAVTRPTGSSE